MFEGEAVILLDILRERQMMDEQQLIEVKEEHERSGKSVAQVIQDFGIMDEDAILQVIAAHIGADYINIREIDFAVELLKTVPNSIARMYGVVPIKTDGKSLTIATISPLNPQVADDLRVVLQKDITVVVAKPSDIQDVINKNYGSSEESIIDVLQGFEEDLKNTGLKEDLEGDVDKLKSVINETPIIRFVNVVLYQAVQDRASDIHFEPFETEFKIRYRVDGALYEMAPPPKHLSLPVTSRLKVMANLDIAERRLPQDGRIQLNIAGRQVDLRISTLPTQFGESVVMRVLDRSVVSLNLESIGLPKKVYDDVSEMVSRPNGIVVVTGPTGSGKTTTLYAALNKINTPDMKLLTAEEPVEYDIEGIMQVPISEATGMTFAKALRAFLRQDPDVIMVGETRDVETAQIAIQASLTGHLVLTTLHTNDSAGAVTRLIDMGVEPFLISSTLQGALAQRLVRTICKRCRTAYEPSESLLSQLNLSPQDVGDKTFYYGRGCHECNDTGYKGRRGIFELLAVTEAIRDLINKRSPSLVIKQKSIEQGMVTIRDDGLRAIFDGESTIEEVVKYT